MSDLVLQTRPCPWMYMEHTDMFLASHVSSFKSFHSGEFLLIFLITNEFNVV